jgi:acetoin utilization protein AcuC
MADRPWFIANDIYRTSRYGDRHPLAIPRVSLVVDLVRALGWLDPSQYVESPVATPQQLARFHEPAYIAAVQRCEAAQSATEDDKRRHNIGVNGNPVFGEIFRRPATACGATLAAVDLLRDGGTVYSPAGGTHHGQAARASGFCYFNDPVLGLLAFLDQGLDRIAYLDIDAHHCDGVEMALGADPRVMILSVHERGRWPFTGLTSDPAANSFNFPMPRGLNDSEFAFVLEAGILPRIEAFAPQAIVVQCGADALADDPMSKLELSNRSHGRTIQAVRGLAPRLLVLGGGGYNPYAVGRCWTGVWAELAGHPVPEALPAAAEALLAAIEWRHSRGRNPPRHWTTTLVDEGREGAVRDEVRAAVGQASRAG